MFRIAKHFVRSNSNLLKKKVIKKGYRNKPLCEKQKASNNEKSKTRARVEHLFGFVENSMNDSFV